VALLLQRFIVPSERFSRCARCVQSQVMIVVFHCVQPLSKKPARQPHEPVRRQSGTQHRTSLERRRPEPRGNQSGGGAEIPIRQEQTFLPIQLKTRQRNIRARDCRRGSGSLASAVHRRDVACILRRPTQYGLFVQRAFTVGECEWAIAPGFSDLCMWVKHDLSTTAYRPSHGLGIRPALVANHHSESERARHENSTFCPACRLGRFF